MKQKIIAGVLCLALIGSVSGCDASTQAGDLMKNIQASPVTANVDLTGSGTTAVADFAVSLYKNSDPSGKNTLISPLSVLYALGMTANGAKGETLSQMEEAFGLDLSELNVYLHAYLENLPSEEKYKLSTANSIWVKDDNSLTVEPAFLQTNADYYGADIYKAAFDAGTLKDINNWVNKNTDGMIENILDEIPANAVMYLINALAFDAEWETIYNETQVQDGTFTTQSGETRDVDMMYSEETKYLNDGSATGFIKYYADKKYAFVALLPNQGVSIQDYVSSLTGEGLMDTLKNAEDIEVKAAIPKFESEYSVEMSDIFKAMGITDAFDGNRADFTGLGQSDNGNISISRVIHKTKIAVDEKGTKAGAATAVEMRATGALADESKTVYLDRPFVYMLVDCESNLPIFIGTTMDIAQ